MQDGEVNPYLLMVVFSILTALYLTPPRDLSHSSTVHIHLRRHFYDDGPVLISDHDLLTCDKQVLIGDSNTGWTSGQALRVANAVKDIDVFIEQPCPTYR